MPLPSLTLQSVTLLSCCVEQFPSSCRSFRDNVDTGAAVKCLPGMATSDHLYCMAIVHVVNQTETTFRLRLRCAINGSDDITCEAKIVRQCSRQLAIEVPRLQSSPLCEKPFNLAGMLNDLLEIEWETCSGIRGRLLCEDHLVGPATEHGRLELFLPPISFQIQSPDNGFVVASTENEGGGRSVPKDKDESGTSLNPSCFFQVPNLRSQLRTLQTGLFTYVPIVISLQRTGEIDGQEQAALCVEVEVVITEEVDKAVREMSDHVMAVGQLKSLVRWDSGIDRRPRLCEIQCMFLSEGNFRVAVCGRVAGLDKKQAGGETWCHQPLYICVRSENDIVAETTARTI
ncbi:unnamed protein product [Hyaloperonospora brassicae]|uniref:Uncharacterized protein n=1 Tax=Hyaloperonospora brassicae TaxID=162125 RepID=A0AAV0TPB4_HYABA|nr:unnamed protein product [Hyaloperonospora brassicae]